jgi:competence protein ComEC
MVAGIVLYRLTSSFWIPVVLCMMAIVALLMMWLYGNNPSKKMRMRSYRIVPLALIVIAVGWFVTWIAEPVKLDEKRLKGNVSCGRIETIKYNEQSMLMQVKLLDLNDKTRMKGVRILLSTRGCNYDFEAGHLIAFKLNFGRVRNMGNPDEMDYAGYLHDKGIIYRQHTDVRDVEMVGEAQTLMTRAFNFRSELQHRVLNSSLSPESQALIIAMLLGNDDFIEPSVHDSFSQAGIAHVLALSGLHVAVISLVIWLLLFPLDYVGGKKVRLLITLLALIAYDVFTGLSPSVIRSTVMIAFVFMSQIFYRKSSPLNSLAIAAIAILIFSPNSFFSVGFQLSFITVASLLIFYKVFDVKFPKNRILNYLYTIFVTSAVAMLSTIVLTAYYFNTISLVSMMTNVLIMPLIPVFMVLGALALVMLAIGGGVSGLSTIIDWITNTIQSLAGGMSALPLSSGSVYVNWGAVVIYYVILVLLGLWIYKRNARLLLSAGVVLVVGIASGLVQDYMLSRRGMVIFNSFNSTPVLYYNGCDAMLWVPDVENDFDIDNFKRWNRAFLAHHHIDSIKLIDSTKCQMPGAVIEPPYANILGTGIIAVGKGHWKSYTRDDSISMRFNVALVTKGFHSQISRLKELVDCDTIVLSGGIYEEDNITLESECKSLNTPYYNIKKSGAFMK